MISEAVRITSGISQLDRILEGLFIGDNVIWYDDAGSLASVFCLRFIQESRKQKKPVIYVSFDRSPKNLLEKLGPFGDYDQLTILDCFTFGKGAGSDIFLKFFEPQPPAQSCRILRLDDPRSMENFMKTFYGTIDLPENRNVRIIFESLTGMQDLWNGEDSILKFYTHSCPRLYELQTVAYWIVEKRAHSQRLTAHINQIAQVVVDLSIRRGKTALTVLKAERRHPESLNRPHPYWSRDLDITFDSEARTIGRIDIGARLKTLRTKRGLSQTEIARLVGVTPSTISQVESNLIYPSLPAIFKLAEIMAVDVSSFFQQGGSPANRVVFPAASAVEVGLPNLQQEGIQAKRLTPVDFESRAEPYLLEIPPGITIPSHFFIHKGEELGYLLSGKLKLKMEKEEFTAKGGDIVYLTTQSPYRWKNPGPSEARLLWIKL